MSAAPAIDPARIPPGQHVVRELPVMSLDAPPFTDVPDDWDVRVWGAVREPRAWTRAQLATLPTRTVTCDVHCVTTWTVLDTTWEGIPVDHVLALAQPLPVATHVMAHAHDGYTANLPLPALHHPGALLATSYAGRPLHPEHGFPLRLLVPHRYLWKSVKWLRGLEVLQADRPGYWEQRGFSNTADPLREERYGF